MELLSSDTPAKRQSLSTTEQAHSCPALAQFLHISNGCIRVWVCYNCTSGQGQSFPKLTGLDSQEVTHQVLARWVQSGSTSICLLTCFTSACRWRSCTHCSRCFRCCSAAKSSSCCFSWRNSSKSWTRVAMSTSLSQSSSTPADIESRPENSTSISTWDTWHIPCFVYNLVSGGLSHYLKAKFKKGIASRGVFTNASKHATVPQKKYLMCSKAKYNV